MSGLYKEPKRRVIFSFLKPVGIKNLFNRKKELASLLSSTRSLVISGPFGIGKSSILKSFKELNAGAVFIDEKGYEDGALDLALEDLAKGQFEEKTSNEVKAADNEDSKTTPVLIMDEWLNIKMGRGYSRRKRLLYSLIKEGAIRVIFSSSEIGLNEEALNDPQLPFGRYMELIKLSPFDLETSVEFLNDGLRYYGVSCGKKALEDAYYISEGFPLWLNLIGIIMVERRCDPLSVLRDKRAQGLVVSRLMSLGKKQREMLRALSMGHRFTDVGPHSRRVLRSLVRSGYVICNDGCHVVDPIMYEMLRREIV